MPDLQELANRIEALPGPSREVFEEAFALCHPTPAPNCEPAWRPENPKQPIYHAWKTRAVTFGQYLDAEAWLDAALLLVPEGWAFMLSGGADCRGTADLAPSCFDAEAATSGEAATPALAVVAAALRAHAAIKDRT